MYGGCQQVGRVRQARRPANDEHEDGYGDNAPLLVERSRV